jgi:hypothetical protein
MAFGTNEYRIILSERDRLRAELAEVREQFGDRV